MIRYLLVLCLLLSGCTTALWAPNYKAVEIEGFYVNPEAGDLIVTSTNIAYIFPVEEGFIQAVNLSREVAFTPYFKDFAVDEKGEVNGIITLVFLDESRSSEVVQRLKAIGFEQSPHNTKGWQLSSKLRGNMYQLEGEIALEKLEKTYVVSVAQPRTMSETIGKVIATPVTVAYDAVVVVPTTLIVFAFAGLMNHL